MVRTQHTLLIRQQLAVQAKGLPLIPTLTGPRHTAYSESPRGIAAHVAAYLGARTWAGVIDGVAELPNAHASMLPSGGTYEDAPTVEKVHVVAPESAW